MNDTTPDSVSQRRRQAILWRALATTLHDGDHPELDKLASQVLSAEDLPQLLLDPRPSIQNVAHRFPELADDLAGIVPDTESPVDKDSVRRAAVFSKLLMNVFGPGASGEPISASQFAQWSSDVGAFEAALGYAPGDLLSGGMTPSSGASGSADTKATGGAPEVTDDDLSLALDEISSGRGLMSEPEIIAGLAGMESQLIERMSLIEVLKDKELAAKLTPSMALTEQLLRQKGQLSGEALAMAKSLIRRYVDQLADVLRKEVTRSPKGRPDPSVVPKRTFANLDVKRTIWRNLPNWDPEREALLVDELHFRRTGTKTSNHRLIIVVDQSGSMIPAMVNCTILASIFAAMPRIDARLFAFDTQVINLSAWVDDPLEVLLRTKLGGGNDGPVAMQAAVEEISDPHKTVMVWISDFYEFQNDQPLLTMIKAVKQSGVTFVPVGSVSSGGYFNVNPWFRDELKRLGTPVLSGSLTTLVKELKTVLPV